jgi:hypothetical protein
MPFSNINYQILFYEDTNDTKNPLVRLPDISRSIQGVQIGQDKSDRIILSPGEIRDIIITSRSVAWDASTELVVDRFSVNSDNVRIKWTGTGTNPNFRTNRNVGGSATTQVSLTRITPYVVRMTQTAGTAFTLTSVSNGDILKFEQNTDAFTSPFNVNNLGKTFQVQAKGANYIDFIDNGSASLEAGILLGSQFAFALRVFSPGSVKVNDTLTISGSMNPSNAGKFNVVDVSPDYIEIVNPFAYPETFLYGTNAITIYEYLTGLLHLRATGPIQLRYDSETSWTNYDRFGGGAFVLASVSAYRIQAKNNDANQDLEVSIQYAKVIG